VSVAIGLGLMDFPFKTGADYWRWVDLCEEGGVDSLWQTDRLVSKQPILECMATMARAGRPHAPPALRHERRVAGAARSGAARQAVRHHRRACPKAACCPPSASAVRSGPSGTALDIDTKTRGKRTDESLEIIARLWREDSGRLRGQALPPEPAPRSRPSRCSPTCRCGSAAPPTPR
jgi:hypothetical protein